MASGPEASEFTAVDCWLHQMHNLIVGVETGHLGCLLLSMEFDMIPESCRDHADTCCSEDGAGLGFRNRCWIFPVREVDL
jgi:hypothetical protein